MLDCWVQGRFLSQPRFSLDVHETLLAQIVDTTHWFVAVIKHMVYLSIDGVSRDITWTCFSKDCKDDLSHNCKWRPIFTEWKMRHNTIKGHWSSACSFSESIVCKHWVSRKKRLGIQKARAFHVGPRETEKTFAKTTGSMVSRSR